jgi:hypothetical protein
LEKYYVIGAEQKSQVFKDWEQYKKGLILEVCPKNHSVNKRVEYLSPLEVCPTEKPSILFTAGTTDHKYLYVGTQTEVLVYSLKNFKKVGYFSLPCFNDIHHVRPTASGTVLIVNTGLDMVVEISLQGEVLNEWSVYGGDPWERFSRKVDYRKVPTTKPHYSHPNYVFTIGNEVWVTRCFQKDAICLTKPNKRINIGRELVHDGVVGGDSIYFTQVDGYVVIANIHTHKVTQVYNLNKITGAHLPLGWCRGIKVLDDNKVIVGFTRIRPSKKTLSNGEVVWGGQYGVLPTRIACYDLNNSKLLWEQQLEDYGMNAVYSIHRKE